MTEAIVVAVITGCFAFLGTIVTVLATLKKTQTDFMTQIAVIETKLENLSDQVKYQGEQFAKLLIIDEQIKEINRRLERLEKETERKKYESKD